MRGKASPASTDRYLDVVVVELGARWNPAAFFMFMAISGLLVAVVGWLSSLSRPKPPRITLNKTLIDGQEVSVIDRARVSQVIQALSAPGPAKKVLLDPNSPAWAELAAATQGSAAVGPDSPFPVIIRVRSALQSGQLDSVRNLLSDQLYQRLSAAPPIPPVVSPPRLIMTTNHRSGDDPNRIIVRVGGSVAEPGAIAEDWIMVRAAPGATLLPVTAQPVTTSPATMSPEAAPVVQPSTCPYCGAPLDKGARCCRLCGMDATLAPTSASPILAAPSVPPLSATPSAPPMPVSQGWIVDDISAANPMAA